MFGWSFSSWIRLWIKNFVVDVAVLQIENNGLNPLDALVKSAWARFLFSPGGTIVIFFFLVTIVLRVVFLVIANILSIHCMGRTT